MIRFRGNARNLLSEMKTRTSSSKQRVKKHKMLVLLSFASACLFMTYRITPNTITATSQVHPPAEDTTTTTTTAPLEWYKKPLPLLSDWPKLGRRLDAIPLLEKMKLKRGIEVGVQKGILAKKTLMTWKACEEYKLVDLWGREGGYQEPNSRTEKEQNSFYRETMGRLKPWTEKGVTEFFPMRSTDAAKKFNNNYFDFIYLDARHDYCALKEEIELYYPKLRPGGILSGHDYTDAQYAIDKLGPHEDWSKCEDGSLHPEGVKGAVDDFAKTKKLYIVTSNEDFPSWYVQKPYH